MLSYISIKNIVLIDKLELNFKKGFTVLTGETGAGKSIIVDAINLLLGNRADRRLIKKGQNEASVSALFSVNQNHEVINILTKYGLVAENEIIIRRKILSNGRSQSFINDEVISLNIMREVSGYLIEVNGQNDQAGLLENSNHIKILDIWGNLSKNTKKVSTSYNIYKDKVLAPILPRVEIFFRLATPINNEKKTIGTTSILIIFKKTSPPNWSIFKISINISGK